MNTKRRKILLIDDESSIRRNLTLSLSQLGYDTEPAENGVNGLKKLDLFMRHNITPVAVVIDIQLPDILGTKLAAIIKFRYPGIPVILITGYVDKFNPEEIIDFDIKALIQKPFNAEKLVEYFDAKHLIDILPENDNNVETSKSGYILIKLEKDAKFSEIYNKLYYMDNTVYCDTTKGDYDIFMLINGNSSEEVISIAMDKVAKIEGVNEVEFLEVINPLLDDATNEILNAAEDTFSDDPSGIAKDRNMKNKVCSYILLDVEKEKLNAIYPVLKLDENVVFCDYTSHEHNIVLFVQGALYSDVDNFIEEKILPLQGILKIKKFPVVNIYEM